MLDVREVRLFVDEQGRQVKKFLPALKKDAKPFFRGVGNMLAQSPGMAPQRVSFEFGFPEGISLEKAFETFDVEANLAVERFKKEQEKRVVSAMSMPNILGPDGKLKMNVKQ